LHHQLEAESQAFGRRRMTQAEFERQVAYNNDLRQSGPEGEAEARAEAIRRGSLFGQHVRALYAERGVCAS
jgi:hypothetical protein